VGIDGDAVEPRTGVVGRPRQDYRSREPRDVTPDFP
jgi:hypothetical protein